VTTYNLDTEPQTLSVTDAAAILGVSRSLIYEVIKQTGCVTPGVPAMRIGTVVRIPRLRLLAYAAGENVG
jgi:excisionase family DNA binding protein